MVIVFSEVGGGFPTEDDTSAPRFETEAFTVVVIIPSRITSYNVCYTKLLRLVPVKRYSPGGTAGNSYRPVTSETADPLPSSDTV